MARAGAGAGAGARFGLGTGAANRGYIQITTGLRPHQDTQLAQSSSTDLKYQGQKLPAAFVVSAQHLQHRARTCLDLS